MAKQETKIYYVPKRVGGYIVGKEPIEVPLILYKGNRKEPQIPQKLPRKSGK